MAKRTINATSAALLGLLQEGPMTGWQLLRTAERRLGEFWSITDSQVYRELPALAQAGLIRAGRPAARQGQPYELTAAGRRAFREWISSPPQRESIRYPLLLTVAFGASVEPDRLRALLTEQRVVHEQRLEAYRRERDAMRAAELPNAFAIATISFGIRHEEATLGWFDEVAEQLP